MAPSVKGRQLSITQSLIGAEGDPSPAARRQPEEIEGDSLFEKKCTLVNQELDRHGMGRYQWSIWALCGFGYLIDLLWAQAFGLVLSPLQQELGFPANQSGNISVAFSSGLTAGAFVWGVLVDVIGRKWAFNLTCFISASFGLGLGACNNYNAFLVVTAFLGFGVGGNIPIDTTICLEFLPQNRRFLLALLSVFQPIGVIVCSAIAYGFIPSYSCSPNFSEPNPLKSCRDPTLAPGAACCDKASNMGWRYLLFTLGAITLGIFLLRFAVFRFQESPKYLIFRNRDAEAIRVLEHIAHFNHDSCTLSLESLEAVDADYGFLYNKTSDPGKLSTSLLERAQGEARRLSILFSTWQWARITVLVWLTYICDFWGFTLAGTFLPTILAHKNSAINLSLKFTYRSYMFIYAPGVVGVMLGALMYNIKFIGRKWAMIFSSAMMGVSIFVFSAVNDEASNIGLNILEYFFQSMFNAILYGWTPEIFPTPVRGTASGLASFWGRLFGIIAPLSAQHLLPSGDGFEDGMAVNRILYLAGGITLGCVITIALLPNNLKSKQPMSKGI